MSRAHPDPLRPGSLRESADIRGRVSALILSLGECARELERGAAIQPASEQLLAARRSIHGSPVVHVTGDSTTSLKRFLHCTLQLRSDPGIDPEQLPARMTLHMDGGGTRSWRLFIQAPAGSAHRVDVPAYLHIKVHAGAHDPPEPGWLCIAELPNGMRVDHLLSDDLGAFWKAGVFAEEQLVDALRAQHALLHAASALDTLRRKVLSERLNYQLAQNALKSQEPKKSAASPRGSDSSLRLVADTVAELVSSVRERARRASTRGSWLWSFQANALGQIGRESIARDERRRITRLTVNEEQIRGIEASFLRTFRGMLFKELDALRNELDGLCRSVEKQLCLPPRSLGYDFPTDQSLWSDVAGYAVVDVRYRGEIQRRGFMERLAEGRKVVFLLLMVGSLAGSFVGFNLRQSGLIGLACLALFVGTIAWSYKSWADEENELIDRETDKLADLVEAAILRATTDALREATAGVVGALESVRKQILQRIESLQDRSQREMEATAANQMKDHQSRLARIDGRLRQLASLEPALQRHAQTLDVVTAELSRQLLPQLRPELPS